MPRGCRPACHTGCGGGETDSARQTSAPRPTATGPTHSRAGCDAWRATARYAAPGAHGESPPRRSRDPRAHSPVVAAVARGRRAAGESHRPTPGLRAGQTNRERRAPLVANQMALAPALGPIGRVRTSLVTAMHRTDGTTVHDRSRPINLIVSSEPIQQREVNEIPHARSLPIAQAAPTRHLRPAAEFLLEHLPGNAATKDKQNADETRAIGDARPSALRPTWCSGQERFD